MCVCDSLHRSVQLFHHQPTNNAHINQSVYTEDKREAPYLSLEDSTVHHIPLHCVNCSISVQTLPAVHTSTSTAQSRFRPSQQYTLVLQLLNLRSDLASSTHYSTSSTAQSPFSPCKQCFPPSPLTLLQFRLLQFQLKLGVDDRYKTNLPPKDERCGGEKRRQSAGWEQNMSQHTLSCHPFCFISASVPTGSLSTHANHSCNTPLLRKETPI